MIPILPYTLRVPYERGNERMNDVARRKQTLPEKTRENIAYIKQMLGQLRTVADGEGCDMLCYLIEMAYIEAGDIQIGHRPLSGRKV